MNNNNLIFVGTYNNFIKEKTSLSDGIYTLDFNNTTGELKIISSVINKDNPSFLTISKNKKYLFSVGELDEIRNSKISSYKINKNKKSLEFINSASCNSLGPCHITIDDSGQYIYTANYSGKSVSFLPVSKSGKLSDSPNVMHHGKGSNVNKSRQIDSHPHSVNIDPTNKYLIVPDLGQDKIYLYTIDQISGHLNKKNMNFVNTKPGSGPRHVVFHPNRKFVYVINELDSTIDNYLFDYSNQTLSLISSISTLPENWKGESTCADIHISPNGKYLYGSNRGHDSIASYKIDNKTGKLINIGIFKTNGKTPRNFCIDPSGKYILVGNQDTDTIKVFEINIKSGEINDEIFSLDIPKPVCILFLKN